VENLCTKVLQKVLQPLYFARGGTKRPFYFALLDLLINAGLAITLSYSLGFIAAAIGTTVAGWVMVLMLWIGSRSMGEAARMDSRLKRALPRLVLATAVMSGALMLLSGWLTPYIAVPGLKYLVLAALFAAGIVVYFAAVFGFGAISVAEFKRAVRR